MEPSQILEALRPAYQQAAEYVATINIEDNQFDTEKLWEEAQKMGLELGDLEEYGFKKSCGGFCGSQSQEEMEEAADLLQDRFYASV